MIIPEFIRHAMESFPLSSILKTNYLRLGTFGIYIPLENIETRLEFTRYLLSFVVKKVTHDLPETLIDKLIINTNKFIKAELSKEDIIALGGIFNLGKREDILDMFINGGYSLKVLDHVVCGALSNPSTGVVSGSEVTELHGQDFHSPGYETEFFNKLSRELQMSVPYAQAKENAAEFLSDYESDLDLFGDWGKDSKGNYQPMGDDHGFSAIYRPDVNVVQIVNSKYIMKGWACSPCYPGQVDLDTPGNLWGYCLPPDMMDSLWSRKSKIVKKGEVNEEYLY